MTPVQMVQGQVAVQDTAQDGAVTVTIRGELDVATGPALRGYLEQALRDRTRLLVIDLAGVEFMDCAAATVIIETCRALSGGPRLILRHPRPVVRRLLSLTGLDAECAVRP